MKKLLSVCLLAASSSPGWAQTQWSVKAGLQSSNITAIGRDKVEAQTAAVTGISLGLEAAIALSDHLALNPALVYARRGFKQDGSSSIGRGRDFNARSSYIELPVDVLFRPKIGPGRLLLGLGPYLGYGTGGRWSARGPVTIGDIRIDGKGPIAFQNDESVSNMDTYIYARPWDYGAHFKIGYLLCDHYFLAFEIQSGIADLQPRFGDYRPEGSVRNKSMDISIGYTFE